MTGAAWVLSFCLALSASFPVRMTELSGEPPGMVAQAVKMARPSKRSFVEKLAWDESILEVLPPQLAITVSGEKTAEAARAAADGKNWRDVDGSIKATRKSNNRIQVTGDGFLENVILWARGDFNRDGVEDLLIQTQDALTEGTYRATRFYVLTRKTKDGKLSVVRQLD